MSKMEVVGQVRNKKKSGHSKSSYHRVAMLFLFSLENESSSINEKDQSRKIQEGIKGGSGGDEVFYLSSADL